MTLHHFYLQLQYQNILDSHSFVRAWDPVSFIILFLFFVFILRISLFSFHFRRIGNKTIVSFTFLTEIATSLNLFVGALSQNSDVFSVLISQQEATTHAFRIENSHSFIVVDLGIHRNDKLLFSTFPSLKLDICCVACKHFNNFHELINLFTSSILFKFLSHMIGLISIAMRRFFSKQNIFALHRAILTIFNIVNETQCALYLGFNI